MTSIDEIRNASPELAAWVDGLPTDGPDVPMPDDVPEALLDLGVPHGDVNEILADSTADLAGLRDRCAWAILARIGGPDARNPTMLAFPGGRLFPVSVALAVAPHTRRLHAARGIDPDVSRHTLADVGRQLVRHRRRHGTPGIVHPTWITGTLRGQIYQLGRLQYERTCLGGTTGAAIAAQGGPAGPGDLSLELHIPDFLGPLTPAACDASLSRAHEFFAGHFPDEPYRVAAIHSWLLDPQLPVKLPPTSHIAGFAARFAPAYPVTTPDDQEPLNFVFDDPTLPRAQLPRDTNLRRALLAHLDAGGHWYGGNGWFAW